MSGVSIEGLLELWPAEVKEAKGRLSRLFHHPSVVSSACRFVDTVPGPERRKTGWMRAEAAGDPGPWRQQAVLGRSHWDADALRDVVRDCALESLSEEGAVLVVDETGFLKQGSASCGVGRQYTGSAGKITNCQIGVFAAYVSSKGHAFIDRQLSLPKAWTQDPARRAAAHVPESIVFATKPRLAITMIERAIRAGVRFSWVAADTVYGSGEVESALRRQGKGYVLGVPCTEKVWSWDKAEVIAGTAEEVAGSLPAARHVRLSAGQGSKGPRLCDWAYVELADLSPQDCGWNEDDRVWTRGLLIRRRLADGEPAFFSTWCPQGTPLAVPVAVEGRRRAIEDAFETAKTELGLDHNETRSWQGWHRHVSLIMLAFALLRVIRHKAQALAAPEKGGSPRSKPWSDGLSRKSAESFGAWLNVRSNRPRSSLGPSGDEAIRP